MTSSRPTETPRCTSREAVANIATHEPCTVTRTLASVAGGQSIVNKAQKHDIFVKVLSPLRVRQAQSSLLTSGTYNRLAQAGTVENNELIPHSSVRS